MAVTVAKRNSLGAFCRHARVDMNGAAKGPLSGLTFSAADLFDIEGYVTGAGNPTWLAHRVPAQRTAPAARSLLNAGARLIGKTQTDELAFSLTGENHHYGTPRNPRAPLRVPGGASSGAASAVAGGAADVALCSDTAGSARIPAAFCGLFGFRPTHGIIPVDGMVPFAPSFDTVGLTARDAGTLTRAAKALLGPLGDGLSKGERPRHTLLVEDAFAVVDANVRTALGPVIDAVTATLGSPRDVMLSRTGLETWLLPFRTLQDFEAWREHGAWITLRKPALGPDVAAYFDRVSTIRETAITEAAQFREAVGDQLDDLLMDGDLLLLPTAPGIAPLKERPRTDLEDFRNRALSLACIASLAGLPEVTLPVAEVDGCPVGLSLIARPGGEALLLAAARQVAATLL
jgi:amidase